MQAGYTMTISNSRRIKDKLTDIHCIGVHTVWLSRPTAVVSLLARLVRHHADDERVRGNNGDQRQTVQCDGGEDIVGQLVRIAREETERDALRERRMFRVTRHVENDALCEQTNG